VDREPYQETVFVLLKNGTPVARITPPDPEPQKGRNLATALRKALRDIHLTREEADAWLKDLEELRNARR
jgi:antitoxin (DNA-binding transcriptional repressor) of toxin-antitoxin stability system